MRVLMVVPAFPKLSETFIVSKFLGLLERDWDVHVLCAQSDPREWERFPALVKAPGLWRRVHISWPCRPAGVAVVLLPAAVARCALRSPGGLRRYWLRGGHRGVLDAFRRLYLDAEIIALRPDILHFEFGALAVGRMHLKRALGCRIVVSFRGYDLNFSGLEDPEYYSEVWQQADALHLLGEDLWRRAQRRGCPPDKPHALIPPALDASSLKPGRQEWNMAVGTRERPLRVVSVGRLEWKKGYEHALQAIRLLSDQGVVCEYHVVGGGSYLEAVAFARHQLGLEGTVELLGARPHEEVLAQLRWADVLLHPAVTEGFCNAVLEAQAMEVPVVCSDAGGLPENVVDQVTGFVVPRRDPQALAEGLRRLAQDPALRERMGKAGRDRVLRHFRLQDQVAAFDGLYRQVLGNDRPPSAGRAPSPDPADARGTHAALR